MPIYEYECQRCFARFEVKHGFGEDSSVPCPKCQGEAHRVFCPVPIIFKGPGFYVTDNRDNKCETEDKPIPEPSKSKPEGEKKEED